MKTATSAPIAASVLDNLKFKRNFPLCIPPANIFQISNIVYYLSAVCQGQVGSIAALQLVCVFSLSRTTRPSMVEGSEPRQRLDALTLRLDLCAHGARPGGAAFPFRRSGCVVCLKVQHRPPALLPVSFPSQPYLVKAPRQCYSCGASNHLFWSAGGFPRRGNGLTMCKS